MANEQDNRANIPTDQGAAESKPEDQEIIEGEVIEPGETSEQVESVPANDYNALVEELQQTQGKAKEFFEGWQRERADFANYKRRIERDQQSMTQTIKSDVIKRYLTVLDDLERALRTRPTDGNAASWANGIELIARKLQTILESEGIMPIAAENDVFNPNRHEAISYEDSPSHESGHIIEVVQQGYTLGDRVIRPALVRVARG